MNSMPDSDCLEQHKLLFKSLVAGLRLSLEGLP